MLSGVIAADEAGLAFSSLADVVLNETLSAVEREFSERHGTVPGARIALLGMGRLGSCELTAGSDLDLILLYDHDDDAEESDGERRLPAPVYFARLTQRLIAALTAPMREGVLYDVDFRLRPSGNKGPLATHAEAFARYQRGEAWTWERMALSRSRPLAGDSGLCDEIAAMIEDVLAERRTDPAIGQDVADMRLRIEKSKPASGPLDLKRRPGGLIDLEFIAQWALLTGRADLDLVGAPTEAVLSAADFGEHQGFADLLTAAMRDFTRVIQILRLGPADVARREDIPEGLGERLASALGLEDPEMLEPRLAETAAGVRQAFEVLLPPPSQDGGNMPA